MKKYAIFGLGKAGNAVAKALQDCYVWDDNEEARSEFPNATPPEQWDWNEIEALVLSAGIPLTHPEPHPIVKIAKKNNTPIICDVELLYRQNPNASYVGITGTNGKSTTTALIGHVLKQAGEDVEVGGNIGIPAMSLPQSEEAIYVLELSSYQLDLLDSFAPYISLLLNISPDHLDRHGGMDGYVATKKKIFNHSECNVIGMDDEYSEKIADEIGNVKISIDAQSDTYFKGETLVYKGAEHAINRPVSLIGEHNKQNIVAAFAVCSMLDIAPQQIISGVESFAGLPHRIQMVTAIKNVAFINDSKATNAESASKALACFDDIYWIAGGREKAGGIESLAPFFPKITKAFLIGEAQDDFAKTLEGKVEYSICNDLETATKKAYKSAVSSGKKSTILLSPACASFDQWASFEKRGDAFIDITESLK